MARALPIPTFLVEQARFLARLLERPSTVGAIAPSSAALGRAMAAQIPEGNGAVLELGPGTGVVTRAILARGIPPSRLTVLEFDPQFAALMTTRFPGINVVQGDAFDLPGTLGETAPLAAIVSSLPLLNFAIEKRINLMSQIFARLAPHAPFIQFSYGLAPPVAPPDGASVMRAAHILFNLPPARVWVYRKADGA
jgi:phosphatidylethanolamine/phosphatidyl-N-methylethanolamine N-methyltransferase